MPKDGPEPVAGEGRGEMCLPQTAAVDDANPVEQTHEDQVEVGLDYTYLVHNAVGNCSAASGMSKESHGRPCHSTAQGSVMSMERVLVSMPGVTDETASRLMCLPRVRVKNQVDVGIFSPKLVHDDVGIWAGEIMSKVEEPAMLLSSLGLECFMVMEEAWAPTAMAWWTEALGGPCPELLAADPLLGASADCFCWA